MLKKHWPRTAKTYWCLNCNVPLISSHCYKCGEEGIELKLREPGDARLAFDYDKRIIKHSLEEKFGTHKSFEAIFRKSNVILLNKTTHVDDAKEVIVDGNNVGILLYNPFFKKWEFRPSYFGAIRLIEENIVETIIANEKIKERTILHRHINAKNGSYIVIMDNSGTPIGLGLIIDQGKIKVVKVFKQRFIFEVNKVNSTLEDILRCNMDKLEALTDKARKFLERISEKVGKRALISFSGGKDSLVSLHLTLSSIGEAQLLFNNTGIELPETIETVFNIAEEYELSLEIADAGNAFWQSLETFGPPARDYRWCCKVAKLVPLARKLLEKWPNGALNIVGQRAYESLERAKSPQIWRNKWVPVVISASPIQYWSQLAIWLYIMKHRLNPNPLYFRGFDRIGCFMCPASRLAEFEEVRKIHPELWSKWTTFLFNWAEKINVHKEWVELGLWRWLGPASPKKVLAKHIDVKNWKQYYEKWIELNIVKMNIEEKQSRYKVQIMLSKPINLELIRDSLYVLGDEHSKRENKLKIVNEKSKTIYIFASNGEIAVETVGDSWVEEILDALKVVYRSHYCVKCESCKTLCPTSSIKIFKSPKINSKTCFSCKVCLDVCPIADVMVEKIIGALILNKYDAWRRRSKRSRENTVKLLSTLLFKAKLSGIKCPNTS